MRKAIPKFTFTATTHADPRVGASGAGPCSGWVIDQKSDKNYSLAFSKKELELSKSHQLEIDKKPCLGRVGEQHDPKSAAL